MLLSRGMSFLLTPVLTRVFDPQAFGSLDLIQTTFLLTHLLMMLSLESAVLRYFNDAESREELVSTAFVALLFTGTFGLTVLFAGASHISRLLAGDDSLSPVIHVAALSLPPSMIYTVALMVLRSQRRSVASSVLLLANSLLYILVVLGYIFGISRGIEALFWGRAIADGACAAAGIVLAREFFRLRFSRQMLVRFLRFSLPLLPEGFITFLTANFSKAVLLHFGSMAEVGLLAVLGRFRLLLGLLSASFRQAWFPFAFSVMHSPEARGLYSRAFDLYVRGMSPPVLFLMMFPAEIVQLFAGNKYAEAARALPMFAVAALWSGSQYVFNIGLLLKDKTGYYTLATLISSALSLILQVLLIRPFGLMGVAIAGFATGVVQSGAVYLFAQRQFHVAYRPVMFLWMTFMSALAFAAPVWLHSPLWMRMIAFAGLTACILWREVAGVLKKDGFWQIIHKFLN